MILLEQEHMIKLSKYVEEVEKLESSDKKRLYRIIEAYLDT